MTGARQAGAWDNHQSNILSLDRYVDIEAASVQHVLNENLHTKIQLFIATQNANETKKGNSNSF